MNNKKSILLFYFHIFVFVYCFFPFEQVHSNSSYKAQVKKKWSHSPNLRKNKKMGIGLGAASIFGLYGASLELNLTDRNSLQVGFGDAIKYKTFHSQFISTVPGKRFSPYLAGGYSIWYTKDQKPSELNKVTPSFLVKRFLDSSDIEKGYFTEHIMYTSIGIQYLQTRPPWVGLAFYGETNLLINVDDFMSAVTGGLGIKYYF